MILASEILRGQICPPELQDNLGNLLIVINKMRTIWARPMIVTSGYRTPEHNKTIGGALNSSHMYCQAIDISDTKGELDAWLDLNPEMLEKCGLWREDPAATPTWCHLDIRQRDPNKRTFKP